MMKTLTTTDKINGAIGSYANYCDGYGNPNSGTGNYILGALMSVGVVDAKLGHEGSHLLDKINAFDVAERNDAYFGQTNMITVSSFCGPHGLVLGYDFLVPDKQYKPGAYGVLEVASNGKRVPVFSVEPLLDATRAMLGTIDDLKFPLIPGCHVSCASKNIASEGPVHVYTAISISIPKDRENAAVLLMEDVGTIPLGLGSEQTSKFKTNIARSMALSAIEIGENQNVEYEKIFVGIVDDIAQSGQFACALVACPYMTLAKNAVVPFGAEKLSKMSLEDWQAAV